MPVVWRTGCPNGGWPACQWPGYYHLDRMIEFAARHGAEVGCCGTCMDARGIADERLVNGARHSTLDEFTDWTMQADKVITF